MKVLHVISNTDPQKGGVAQGLKTVVSGLSGRGVYNEVVSLDSPNASYLGKGIYKVNALGPGSGPWCYSPKLIPWLVKNLHRFDSVVVHGIWLFHGYAVHIALSQYKKRYLTNNLNNAAGPKLFIFPQGMLDPYFQKAPSRKFKAVRNWFYWKLIEQRIINNANGVFFTAETERQLAEIAFRPYDPNSEIIVGMGVKAPPPYNLTMKKEFYEKCAGLHGEPYILFLSRIQEKKGVDVLIKAYIEIRSKLNKIELPKLVIAGPGLETEYGRKILKLASKANEHQPNIFFTGMLEGDAKWGAFYGCEAFVLPTHQENFGIAIVEALACGKPALISNQTNIWREIEEQCGGIVGSDKKNDLIRVLQTWFNMSQEEKLLLGQNAIRTYKKYFSIDSIVEKWIKALK